MRARPTDLNLLESVRGLDGDPRKLRPDMGAVASMNSINRDPQLLGLFHGLLSDPHLRKVMFSHRRHLSLLEGIEIPILYGDSPPDAPVDRLVLESRRATAHSKAAFLVALDRFWANLESYVKGIIERVSIEFAGKKIGGSDMSEADQARMGMSLAMEMLIPPGSAGDPVDRWIKAGARLGGDVIPPLINAILAMPKADAVALGRKSRNALASAAGLDLQKYQGVVETLHLDLRVMAPLLALLWCPKCRDVPYSLWATGLRMQPDAKCPICGTTLACGMFYYFEPAIAKLVRDDDGLLSSATCWMAEEAGVPWSPRSYLVDSDKYEHDIVFQRTPDEGYGLVELKTLALDASEAAKKSNVRDGLVQLSSHFDEFASCGIPVTDLALVTNYSMTSAISSAVQSVRKSGPLRQFKGKVRCFGLEEFPALKEYFAG